jgi:uncharacterized membrane protein
MLGPSTAALLGIGAAAVLAVALLVTERPPATGATALAAAPWAVVAGLLHALAGVGAYPPALARFLSFPGAFVVAFIVAMLVWVPLLQLATMRDFDPGSGQYLAAAGGGTGLVLLFVVLLRQGLGAEAMLWLAATPVAGALLAGGVYFFLGFVDPSTLATMRWVGYMIVLGFAVLGTALAVGVDVFGSRPGTLVDLVVTVADGLPTADRSVGWPLAALGALVGLAMASLVSRVVRDSPAIGYVLAVCVAAVSLGPAVGHLLLLTIG